MSCPADPTVINILDTVRSRFPNVPFLALGQTVLWDEPMKAVWHRLLEEFYPEAQLIAGIHDTDYFAKTTGHIGSASKFAAFPHDDGLTRDLWSAAGEMSCLFGSESVPTRNIYQKYGVPFDWLAKHSDQERATFLREHTSAYGWLGIVQTDSDSMIAHDIPVIDIRPALMEQLDWALGKSVASIVSEEARQAASSTAATIRGWVSDFLDTCSENCRLSDLYRWLLPRFYRLMLGYTAHLLETTTSIQLFNFGPSTQHLARFDLLRVFLDLRTRKAACDAYSAAVAGSGIYALDSFGDGALPFDVVIPLIGRGTLRLMGRDIIVETTPSPTRVRCEKPVTTAEELADALVTAFGDEVVLVGKAVALADMISAEFLVLFHESASGYTSITADFNARMAQSGIETRLYPIIRIKYQTWDSMLTLRDGTEIALPGHLAEAFGCTRIEASEFGSTWKRTVERQKKRLEEFRSKTTLNSLLKLLAIDAPNIWQPRSKELSDAVDGLKNINARSEVLRGRQYELQQQRQSWIAERLELERRMGEDWRNHVEPIRARLDEASRSGMNQEGLRNELRKHLALRQATFVEPLAECRERINSAHKLSLEFKRQRRILERSQESQHYRSVRQSVTRDAEMERMRQVRGAYLTVESLEHTDDRPTAWWLPVVDPTNTWFDTVVAGTSVRFEGLSALEPLNNDSPKTVATTR